MQSEPRLPVDDLVASVGRKRSINIQGSYELGWPVEQCESLNRHWAKIRNRRFKRNSQNHCLNYNTFSSAFLVVRYLIPLICSFIQVSLLIVDSYLRV